MTMPEGEVEEKSTRHCKEVGKGGDWQHRVREIDSMGGINGCTEQQSLVSQEVHAMMIDMNMEL